ncbi:hypothetical protein [Peterkaempfera sp. SMS 1(5)a]|uniref:hypothetical protein n=1 Tax=Peterkaempfera podocarpi TaxID=3232308 RepID=UPI003672CD37
MRHLTLAQADVLRARRGSSALLYLTDRCPVGCDHCSVSALPRPSGTMDDKLLDRLVGGLCERPRIRLVGISGGEPFMERRALESATGRLAKAGKQLILYTSGNWGRDDGTAPGWTRAVLSRASCVVLSTDSHHAARIPESRYLAALHAAASTGSWIAVQVLGTPAQTAEAERLLTAAFGTSWRDRAEIRRTALVRRGRAAGLTPARSPLPGSSFGVCPLASAPVVRYDGRLAACCNEDVVTGHGPASLHSSARDPQELHTSLDALERDPFLRAATAVGLGTLTRLPSYRVLGEQNHQDICSLCWSLLDAGAGRDPAVQAIGLAATQPGTPHAQR